MNTLEVTMDDEIMDDVFETLRKAMPDGTFVSLMLRLLDKNPSPDMQDRLQALLTIYQSRDERVIDYWKSLLYSTDRRQSERASETLFMIGQVNERARIILKQFFGKDITKEELRDIRFKKLGLKTKKQ
jgi:hypothetical protein